MPTHCNGCELQAALACVFHVALIPDIALIPDMFFSLPRVISPAGAGMSHKRPVKYIVLDLDQTLGDFGNLSTHVNALETALNRVLTVRELFSLFCSFPQLFRTSIIKLLTSVYESRWKEYAMQSADCTKHDDDNEDTERRDDGCAPDSYKVVLYTNNSGKKAWAAVICAFVEWFVMNLPQFAMPGGAHSTSAATPSTTRTRASSNSKEAIPCRFALDRPWRTILDRPRSPASTMFGSGIRGGHKAAPRLFDGILGSYKSAGGAVNEPARTTYEKTYDDLCRALKQLNIYCENHSILFVDDQVHPSMINAARVTYFLIPAYHVHLDPAQTVGAIAKLFMLVDSRDEAHLDALSLCSDHRYVPPNADALQGHVLSLEYGGPYRGGAWHIVYSPVDGEQLLRSAISPPSLSPPPKKC